MNTKKWVLDPAHSELQFKVKHMMVSNVTGYFNRFNIEVETSDEEMENARIQFTADADSIYTKNEQRDEHLKSKDFFDRDHHPQLRFESTSFKKIDESDYALQGNLTIRDITKPVKLQVTFGGEAKDPWGNIKAGFSVSGKINRKDWGLTYNTVLETGGVMVGDEIRIFAEIQMKQLIEEVA